MAKHADSCLWIQHPGREFSTPSSKKDPNWARWWGILEILPHTRDPPSFPQPQPQPASSALPRLRTVAGQARQNCHSLLNTFPGNAHEDLQHHRAVSEESQPLPSSSPQTAICRGPLCTRHFVGVTAFRPNHDPSAIMNIPSYRCRCICAQLLQACPTLCDPMDCSPPSSSVHGILQARILEQVVMHLFQGI